MRAAWFDRPGPAREVIKVGDIDRPSPSSGEVLVHLKASGITRSDTKSRGMPDRHGERRRRVLQSDRAGIVEQVGAIVSRGPELRAMSAGANGRLEISAAAGAADAVGKERNLCSAIIQDALAPLEGRWKMMILALLSSVPSCVSQTTL